MQLLPIHMSEEEEEEKENLEDIESGAIKVKVTPGWSSISMHLCNEV